MWAPVVAGTWPERPLSCHSRRECDMSETCAQATDTQPWALVGLLGVAVIGFYILALDQGWLLSLVQGDRAFDLNFIHEAVHDARHVAGFPCH
jgi:hypothetical protein